MTSAKVKSRLALFTRPLWSYDEVAAWYNLDARPVSFRSLEVQYDAWADACRDKASRRTSNMINRFYLELFLQRRELVPLRLAAAHLSMDAESFCEVLEKARENGLVSPSEADGEMPGIYRQTLLRDFHKRFPALQHKTFASDSSFIDQLHKQIKRELGVSVKPLHCVTSLQMAKATGEPCQYGHDFDIITNDPMGNRYQVWLNTGKPIQLRPDACSYVTYHDHEKVLKGHVYGDPDHVSERVREALEKVVVANV